MSLYEEHLSVNKSARLYLLGEPSSAADVWIVCHGYGQLANRFITEFECIAANDRLIVAPEALHRYYIDPLSMPAQERRVGATWMTREDRHHDIVDYVAYLDRVVEYIRARATQPFRLRALGFSQGSATAFRWAVQGRTQLADLILWAGEVPGDADMKTAARRLADTRVILARGSSDELTPEPVAQLQRERLEQAGIAYQAMQYSAGHRLESNLLKQLAAI